MNNDFRRLMNTSNESLNSSIISAFKTPLYLFEMGICLCDTCGKLHSIDYAFCNDCFREIFIDVDRSEKQPDEKILKK